MEINVLEQLKNMVSEFGVDMFLCDGENEIAEENDSIYRLLGINNDVIEKIQYGMEKCRPGVLYIITNCFELIYMFFLYDKKMVVIGPFVGNMFPDFVDHVMEKNEIPLIFRSELCEFYNKLPIVQEQIILENLVALNMRYLYDADVTVEKQHRTITGFDKTVIKEQQILEKNKISAESIEKRYQRENRLMQAIASGNIEQVLDIQKEIMTFTRVEQRGNNPFRSEQNYLIILNTLYRRAAQSANVHPAHIDFVSSDFANRIENAATSRSLLEISKEMVRKYCLLVKNYSLQGYSEMVRNALNYIDFNLKEDLSLNAVAEYLSVNASYLSKQFKKENEKTLTDYVNEKRITTSLKYLAATDIPVQKIAEMVGIYDENYYSRLFKKYQKLTPSQYRSLMRSE